MKKIQTFDLVGGFNPVEKYESNWIIAPGKGENKKHLKPPSSNHLSTLTAIRHTVSFWESNQSVADQIGVALLFCCCWNAGKKQKKRSWKSEENFI